MRRISTLYRFVLPALLCAASAAAAQTHDEAAQSVGLALDELHDAAAAADFERYFSVYDPGAIFLGTDASERWTRDEFMEYAKPHFDRGRGWKYLPSERNIYIAADGQTAWFDERLDNEFLGETRGTGVLIRVGDQWKFAQYNLTIPVPNGLAGEFVARIREDQESAEAKAEE